MYKRSKLGRFLEKHGYNQSQLSKMADLNKNTVTRIYTDSSYMPSGNTISKVMKALKRLDPSLKAEDFLTYKRHNYCAFINKFSFKDLRFEKLHYF
ncbi:helix-turn-helix transcriptional regulator [Bacillus megaterium]|nr:helix-turn-helix transcriptional regulator [Priestia megaterium]